MKFIGSRSRLVFIFLLLFTIANITDMISSYFVLGGEANPLYLLTGSVWLLYGLKIGVSIFFWWLFYHNTYDTEFLYYQYLMLIVLGTIGFSLGAFSNIWAIVNPQVMSSAVATTTGEKISYYTIVSIIIYVIPAAMSLFMFKLFQWTHKSVKIKKRTMTWQSIQQN